MGIRRRISVAILVVMAGVAFAGVGIFLTKVGLDDADKWASIGSMFLTALGLVVAVYGVVLTRRGLTRQAAGQRVGGDVMGENLQIGDARDVRVGSSAGRPRPKRRRTRRAGRPLTGGQEVGGSVGGGNIQIGRADDVDVD